MTSLRPHLLAVACIIAATMLSGCTATSPPTSPSSESVSASPSAPSFRSRACSGRDLAGSLDSGGGGSAGASTPDVRLKNTSSTTCVISGWPAVALATAAGGTPIGAAATRAKDVPHPAVTLAPGQTALMPLKISDALNYPENTCQPTKAGGLTITPPSTATPLFVPLPGVTACSNPKVPLLIVSAAIPTT